MLCDSGARIVAQRPARDYACNKIMAPVIVRGEFATIRPPRRGASLRAKVRLPYRPLRLVSPRVRWIRQVYLNPTEYEADRHCDRHKNK